MATASTIERLLAEDAIRRALLAYCRGVDRGDSARVLEAYHPDGVDHHGTWDGRAQEHLDDALRRLVDRTLTTVHLLGPSTFAWRDERTVRVESNVLALHEVVAGSGRSIEHLHGRYLDVFTLVADDWRISERTFVRDLDVLDGEARAAYPAGVFTDGGRGDSDPSAPWSRV